MIKVIWNVIKKLFGIITFILSPLKRLWCRRKRRNSDTLLPMSNHYPSVENLSTHYPAINGSSQVQELSPWDTWEDQQQSEKVRSVEEYRQRQQQSQQQSQDMEPEPDYFQDMTPAVKRQKKILLKKKDEFVPSSSAISNKLAMSTDIPVFQSSELGSWEDENNAWEAEADEDLSWEADNVIREKRKADRQQRHLQQQRKKQEREQQQHKHGKPHLSAVRLS